MNSKEIIDYLKSEASEKYKENVIKMGIPEKFCIGVSTSTLRKFAKKLDKSNELAFELWNTHYHEARLLAVLIFDHKCLSYDQIDTLMSEVLSWDLCDHLTAYDLLASGNKVQIWIAKDVIKELETVVKVKERKRLITSNSKMGRER